MPHLDRLVDLWMANAEPSLHGVYPQFVGDRRQRFNQRMVKEIGYRHRHRRFQPEGKPQSAVGTDLPAVRRAVSRLALGDDEVLVVPRAGDPALVGAPVYPGSNPPNPFQWVPVLARHSNEDDIIWEMGPGLSSSAGWVGQELDRHVWLVNLPAPGSREHSFRVPAPHRPGAGVERDPTMPMNTGVPLADINETPPALVLVSLPVPLDAFSVQEFAQAHIRSKRGGERIFNIDPEQEWIDLHPEFAMDTDSYIDSTVARLRTLGDLVREAGSRVCVAAPMVKGTPRAVERAVHRHMDWKVLERITVFEDGGTQHAWNGTPLVGTALTIWMSA